MGFSARSSERRGRSSDTGTRRARLRTREHSRRPTRRRPCTRGRGRGSRALRGTRGARRRHARRPGARARRDASRPGGAPLTAVQDAAYPVALQQQVDDYLRTLSFSREPATQGLEDAMRYSLLAGGKRIRPVLALSTAEALERDTAHVLPLAAALELIHTYSLIHDDLPAMDDDDTRRGKLTNHKVYGEDVAILAGDALFAEAVTLVLQHQQGDPANILAALREITGAAAVSGMVGGQFVDITASEADLDADGLRHLHELKTGRLIGASIESVLRLEGTDGPATIPYTRFAAELGVLFQIVDDILDVTGDEEALGKPHGSDERHGKRTYVSVFGLERARELARESHAKARSALQEADGATGTLDQISDYILTRKS